MFDVLRVGEDVVAVIPKAVSPRAHHLGDDEGSSPRGGSFPGSSLSIWTTLLVLLGSSTCSTLEFSVGLEASEACFFALDYGTSSVAVAWIALSLGTRHAVIVMS